MSIGEKVHVPKTSEVVDVMVRHIVQTECLFHEVFPAPVVRTGLLEQPHPFRAASGHL